MEKYRLVEELKGDGEDFLDSPPETPSSSSNASEVRITQQGKPRNYISYAMTLFSSGHDAVVLKAMGRAINKAVTIAEILKRKLPLHQVTQLSSLQMMDVFEPLEEGLDVVTSKRYVSCMKITLSTSTQDINLDDIGYQPPIVLLEAGDVSGAGGVHGIHPSHQQHATTASYASAARQGASSAVS